LLQSLPSVRWLTLGLKLRSAVVLELAVKAPQQVVRLLRAVLLLLLQLWVPPEPLLRSLQPAQQLVKPR
jgi:hypothetical protein